MRQPIDHNEGICTEGCGESSARPPTKASCMSKASESLVQSLLQFLHGKCPHRLRGWLGLEDTRLLGERIYALHGRLHCLHRLHRLHGWCHCCVGKTKNKTLGKL